MNLMLRQNLLLMVRTLYFCMEKQWEELGREYNITPAQQHILFLLSTNDEVLTPTQIGELGCWHISTVTRLLKPMQDKGLVSVKTDEKHPRFKNVKLNPEGKLLLNKLINTVKDMDRFPFDMKKLSEQEIMDFLKYGQLIIDVHKGNGFKNKVINAQVVGIDYELNSK